MMHSRPATPYKHEVDAFNVVFGELGIEWNLDEDVYARHGEGGSAETRLAACIEAQYPHLLKAYDRAFLGGIASAAAQRMAA
jgi:hypothetical protein